MLGWNRASALWLVNLLADDMLRYIKLTAARRKYFNQMSTQQSVQHALLQSDATDYMDMPAPMLNIDLHPTTLASTATVPTSYALLQLAPELRNHIWEYAVIDSNVIAIDDGWHEPGLLLACKQIRNEARPFFYCQNSFTAHPTEYNSDIYIPVTKRYRELQKSCGIRLPYTSAAVVTLGPNWSNVLEWLRRFHAREVNQIVLPPTRAPGMPLDMKVVGTMFESLDYMKSTPWVEVAQVMEEHHQLLVAIDRRWA